MNLEKPTRNRAPAPNGPRPLGVALAVVGRLEDPALLGSAEHCHSMAPWRGSGSSGAERGQKGVRDDLPSVGSANFI